MCDCDGMAVGGLGANPRLASSMQLLTAFSAVFCTVAGESSAAGSAGNAGTPVNAAGNSLRVEDYVKLSEKRERGDRNRATTSPAGATVDPDCP